MAQNITIMGASYSAVPAVTLPKTGGGTASFTDVTDTTATAADVASGKYFYTASGEKVEGTASGGGSARTTIVPEQTANYSERYNQINFTAPLVVGEVYIYTIDGVESQGMAFDNYGSVAIGSPDTSIGFEYASGIMYLSIANSSLRTTHTIKVEQESGGGGGSATLITKSITANGTYDASDDNADGYSSVTVNVPVGGGIGTLLNTTSIGTVNTTSTQAASLNVSCEVSGINSYDLLIVETSVNTKTNGRHACTVGLIFLTASSSIGTKDGATVATAKMNMKLSSNGTATSVAGTTAYGIYPNSCSVSNGTATIPMYRRYNSTSTGTINGTYTARVYGVKLYDLIGG